MTITIENESVLFKNKIPEASVSADTVGDLINQLRGEGSRDRAAENEASAENAASAENKANQPEKKSVIPPAVVSGEEKHAVPENKIPEASVSADTVGDLINQMRGEGSRDRAAEDEASAENKASSENKANQPEKKSVIPKAVVSGEEKHAVPENKIPEASVSADSELDKLRDLLTSGRELEIDSSGRIVAAGSSDNPAVAEKPTNHAKAKTIPEAVVSAPQWYETNKDLYNAEVAAMRSEFNNPNLQPRFMDDGRMYWVVNVKPNLGTDKYGNEYKTLRYKLLLVYDADHPKVRYGSSVKVYPASPTIEEMQGYVNRLPSVARDKKNIPHVLPDETGHLYLCSADTSNVSADISKGITSAATSYRFALKWLTIFELGIRDPETWEVFQRHGEI